MSEKKQSIVYILGAIAFVILGVNLLKVYDGTASIAISHNPNGSLNIMGILNISVPFYVLILCLCGILVILQDGEFLEWLPSAGVILVIALISHVLIFLVGIGGFITCGLYALVWVIGSVKGLWESLFDSWETLLIALCRVVVAVALVALFIVWVNFDYETGIDLLNPNETNIFLWGGILSIAGAVALVGESFLWMRELDY